MSLELPYFCVIPYEVRANKNISESAKIFYGELAVLSNKYGYCFASDEELAAMKGVDVRTIKRWLEELEKQGTIQRDTKNELSRNEDGKERWKKRRKIYVNNSSKNVSERDKNVPSHERDKNVPYKETITERENLIDKRECGNVDKSVRQANASKGEKLSPFFATQKDIAFDPETYVLKDGMNLSLRMQRAIKKFRGKDVEKLKANIRHYEKACDEGYLPRLHEAFLQSCISRDYASAQANCEKNDLYARFALAENKDLKIKIMKTVVKVRTNAAEPPHSILKSLPHETFCGILDNYIQKLY